MELYNNSRKVSKLDSPRARLENPALSNGCFRRRDIVNRRLATHFLAGELKADHVAATLMQATGMYFSKADWPISETWKRVERIYENTANNSADGNTSDGFNFVNVLAGGQADGNTANGNSTDGFDFVTNTAGGTFSNNTANNNGDLGFEVTNPNAGTAVNNTGVGNTNGSNIFP